MGRSLKVDLQYKDRVTIALKRQGVPSQKALSIELGLARDTINKFFNCKPIDYLNFVEICHKLGLDWQEICYKELPPDSAELFYVERPPLEDTCYKAIVKPGGLIRIKAPQKMGKTLLLQKALDYARGQGYQTVELTFDQTVLDDYSSFLKWFCVFIGDTLDIENTIDKYWQSDLGIQRNCTKYFEEVLLPSIDSELVIAMDEFETLFEFPEIFRKFCPLIRSWFNKARKPDNSSKIWKKLRIVIVYSTQLYPKLDPNHSPLNVGTPIKLKGFTQEEVETLVTCRQLEQKFKNQDEYLKLLIKLVNGHPDLIQQALDHLQNENKTIADPDLWKTIFTEEGIFSIYLTEQLENLDNNPDLKEAYKKVIAEDIPVRVNPQKLRFQLHSLGLIKFVGNDCVPSCDLYHNYFSDILLNNNQRSQQWLSNLQLAGL